MCEGLVCFGHLVHVFFLLNRTAFIICCCNKFCGKLLRHRFILALACIRNEPALRKTSNPFVFVRVSASAMASYTMLRAVVFFPCFRTLLMKRATRISLNFGSGKICRLVAVFFLMVYALLCRVLITWDALRRTWNVPACGR